MDPWKLAVEASVGTVWDAAKFGLKVLASVLLVSSLIVGAGCYAYHKVTSGQTATGLEGVP